MTTTPASLAIARALSRLKSVTDQAEFSFFNEWVKCVPSRVEEDRELELGGRVETIDAWIYVLYSDIPQKWTIDTESATIDATDYTIDELYQEPRVGNRIKLDGAEYRIVQMDESPCKTFLKFYLRSVDR